MLYFFKNILNTFGESIKISRENFHFFPYIRQKENCFKYCFYRDDRAITVLGQG